MSTSKLSFEGVKRTDPLSFARAINNAQIFQSENDHIHVRRDLTGLLVTFAGARFLNMPDLATVAVVIKRVADEESPSSSAGREVPSINPPP